MHTFKGVHEFFHHDLAFGITLSDKSSSSCFWFELTWSFEYKPWTHSHLERQHTKWLETERKISKTLEKVFLAFCIIKVWAGTKESIARFQLIIWALDSFFSNAELFQIFTGFVFFSFFPQLIKFWYTQATRQKEKAKYIWSLMLMAQVSELGKHKKCFVVRNELFSLSWICFVLHLHWIQGFPFLF